MFKVVSAEDGKRLHISCNRLLGKNRLIDREMDR